MEGTEQIIDALRRSKWIVMAAVVAGIAGMTALAALSGPRYEAVAQVLQPGRDPATVLGVGGDQDPQREGATGVLLAQTGAFYRQVVDALPDDAVAGRGIRGEFRVEQAPGTDFLIVTGIAGDGERAQTIANTAADQYVLFRAEALAAPLESGREGVEELQEEDAPAALQDSVSRLQVLEALARRGARVVDTAERADRTRPRPVRDALLGLSTGLVIGLLLVALREALGSRRRSLEAVRRRTGAGTAVTLPLRGAGGGRERARLVAALKAVAGDRRPALVVVTGLDGPGAVAPALELVADALADAGERVLLTAAEPAHEPRRSVRTRAPVGGLREGEPAAMDSPDAMAAVGDRGDAAGWILVPEDQGHPSGADAWVLAVHADALAAARTAAVHGPGLADVHRVVVALKD